MPKSLMKLGRTGEAIPYVEMVRNRAGLTAPLSGFDQTSLGETDLLKERTSGVLFLKIRGGMI